MTDPKFFRKYLDILEENDDLPKVKNVIVPPSMDAPRMFSGRLPATPDQVTHAYRNMSPAEFDSAMKSGYFTKNPNPGKTTWDTNQKFWSQGDAEGHFGRTWKAGKDVMTVRVPIGNVPPETAVHADHVEYKNSETGKWERMRPLPSSSTSVGTRMPSGGGNGGTGVQDTRDLQLGADLDPKAMMRRNQR